VLVIGAGPAGAAAARVLALAGRSVLLIDRRAFPRDKVCGDGLIRDAVKALTFLGVNEVVGREAWHGTELRVYAPGGAHVSLAGEFACLPRERLDHLLLEAALRAGVEFQQGTAMAPLIDNGWIAGARVRDDARERAVSARFTVLATGGNATALEAFGIDAPPKPDAVAGRAYFVAPPDVAGDLSHLSIVYQREWCPGYGWIFPGPEHRFNVGVGLFGRAAAQGRLRQFFTDFCRSFPPASRLVQHATLVRDFRGAPIRSGLGSQMFGRPGLLAVGEAVATTYPATGEGIGKSMESGILAAEMIRDALDGRRWPNGLEDVFRRRFHRRYSDRYRAYRVAQRWAASPRLLDLLASRANHGTFIRRELEALVAERGNPRALFSVPGLLKALVSG
jgi:geranylgeranyl reductase family protein